MNERLLRKIVFEDIQVEPYLFRIQQKGDGFLLQAMAHTKDSRSDKVDIQSGRKWYVSSHACRAEVVRTCYMAIEAFMKHELQENFLYKGKRIFNPHWDPDALAEVEKENVRE
ncbi:MAG: hypothetical protein ACYDHY_06630 [Acidiferrobacterales bacterium]